MSIETMTKLATYTVGVGGTATLTFSNIPQTYTDLVVRVSARTSTTGSQRNATDISVTFNGSSTGYSSKILTGNAAVDNPPISVSNSGSSIVWGAEVPNADATANVFSNSEIYIPNYTSSNYKNTSTDSVTENNSSNSEVRFSNGLWTNTSPITSLTLTSGTLVQHSTFTLYGVKAMRTAVGNSIKATGGNISFDGTYVTHTFNSTSTFTPTANLTADYLVVAGGGGSGNTSTFGGGGAGGLRSTVTATGGGGSLESKLTLAAGTAYTVIIGAGGTNSPATNGSDSVFSTITSTGGGKGGVGGAGQNAGSGGSGGGASYQGSIKGTGTANQGYDGGTGGTGAPNYGSGGGGGAGAAGSNGSNTAAGNGGIGVAVAITGTSIYYAGGGGGNADAGTASSGGLGGGGNGGVPGGGTAGTANTGGGGGTGNGGSGIVIIRYKG
jgi:hypothetical protein